MDPILSNEVRVLAALGEDTTGQGKTAAVLRTDTGIYSGRLHTALVELLKLRFIEHRWVSYETPPNRRGHYMLTPDGREELSRLEAADKLPPKPAPKAA